MSRENIKRWGVLVGLMGIAVWSMAGCDLQKVTIPGPTGISTAQYILRLSLVPDIIDINDFGTDIAKLRAHLTDWNGSNLAGKTIFFEVVDFTIVFGADGSVTVTEREFETQKDCALSGNPPRCDLTSCTAPIVTSDTTNTTTQRAVATGCEGIVNAELFGRINPRKAKTGPNGLAVSTFTPFGSFDVKNKVSADLFDDAVTCLSLALNVTDGSEVTRDIEELDLDNNGTNETCRVTETTTTTTTSVVTLVTNFPNTFDIPIRATWIEADHPDQVKDQNMLRVTFPQWDND